MVARRPSCEQEVLPLPSLAGMQDFLRPLCGPAATNVGHGLAHDPFLQRNQRSERPHILTFARVGIRRMCTSYKCPNSVEMLVKVCPMRFQRSNTMALATHTRWEPWFLLVRVPTEEKTECRSVYDAGLQTTVVKKNIARALLSQNHLFCMPTHSLLSLVMSFFALGALSLPTTRQRLLTWGDVQLCDAFLPRDASAARRWLRCPASNSQPLCPKKTRTGMIPSASVAQAA